MRLMRPEQCKQSSEAEREGARTNVALPVERATAATGADLSRQANPLAVSAAAVRVDVMERIFHSVHVDLYSSEQRGLRNVAKHSAGYHSSKQRT